MIKKYNGLVICRILLFTSVLALISSCKKSNDEIPYVYVNEYINLSLPSYINLNSINGWVYYGAASKGIIVFRRSVSEFLVFDRTCPYDPEATCSLVKVIPNNIIAIDSCCGSRYSLFDGSVVNGPSTNPLKQYKAILISNNTLHVYN